RDMAGGGQGAPIVLYSEYILYRHHERTRLLQNIGGIGNVTVIPPNASLNDLVAFDTGPGNMVINELTQHFYNESYDRDGKYAQEGTVNQEVLEDWMNHSFILREPPKRSEERRVGKENKG